MSATIIKILNSGTSGSPSALATGELAYSYLSGTLINGGDRLYIGTGTETNGEAANIEVIGGKYFTDMLDHTKGVLTVNSALVVDADGKLDILHVDNVSINTNTIYTTNTNGDLVLDPNGTGKVEVNSDLYVTGNFSVDGALTLGSDVGISGTLTVDDAVDFNSTLNVDGQSTLASVNVTDLTDNRIVIVGVDGELEDDANFTFNGTQLNIGLGNFTVQQASGNTQIVGTLNVDAQSTLASVNVEDLTNNRIVIVGSSGELEDDANFTFDGTELSIGVGNFTVDQATGNVYALGTLEVDGQGTIASLNVEDLTATRITFAGTSGELEDSADLAFIKGTSTLNLTGQLNVDNVRIDGNTISITNTDGDLVLTPNGAGIVSVNSTQALKIPVGTLAQRPSGVQGSIRFNITDGRFEGFDGTAWNGLGGVIDVDQNTFVRAETSPGANNNDLEFYTDGVKRVNLDENGMVFTDTSIPLEVGDIKIEGTTISTMSGGTMYLEPSPIGPAGTVVIEGNLQVNGTTTQINSTQITVDDPVMVLGGDTAPESDDNKDRGIAFQYHDGTSAKLGFFGWDDSAGRFTFMSDATDNNSAFTGSASDVEFGNALLDTITISTGNYTSNGVMYTDTSGDVQYTASSTEGHVLQINASGVPVFGIIDCGTY